MLFSCWNCTSVPYVEQWKRTAVSIAHYELGGRVLFKPMLAHRKSLKVLFKAVHGSSIKGTGITDVLRASSEHHELRAAGESWEVRKSAGHSQSPSASKVFLSGIWYGIWNLLTYTADRVLIWGSGTEQGRCLWKSQKQYIWKLQAWGFPLWWLGGPRVICTQQRRRVVTVHHPFETAACRRGCHLSLPGKYLSGDFTEVSSRELGCVSEQPSWCWSTTASLFTHFSPEC